MKERLIMLAKEAELNPAPSLPEEPTIEDVVEGDWIGMRLLSMIISTDLSSLTIRDIRRSMKYYSEKYSTEVVLQAFALINRERTEQGEWHNPESNLIRKLKNNMKATDKGREI